MKITEPAERAFCKVEAEPIGKCSNHPVGCEKGWIERKTIHHVFCYLLQPYSASSAAEVYDLVINDICARNHQGAHLLSIESTDEDEYIYYNFAKNSLMSLHMPLSVQNLPIQKELFEWTAPSPVHIDFWEDNGVCNPHCPAKRTSREDTAGLFAYTRSNYEGMDRVNRYVSGRWHNVYGNYDTPAICKKSFKNCIP